MYKYFRSNFFLGLGVGNKRKLKNYFALACFNKQFSNLNINTSNAKENEKYQEKVTSSETTLDNLANDSSFSPSTSDKFMMKISFHSKMQISKDGYVIRFRLPEDTSSSKFNICRYVYLEGIANRTGEVMKRPYHPISLDTDKGFIDIFIKVYEKNPQEKFGIFSNFLANLQEGQVIALYGSYGNIQYKGHGNFSIFKPSGNGNANDSGNMNEKETINKKVKKIGMIAGGSGIAPMFQLIQKIITSKDNTAVSLIYCTKSIDEMSFGEDLIKFDRKGKISFYPVVENVDSANWAFGKGKVDEEMIFNYMPDLADDEGVILICGTRAMIESYTKPMLKSIGYKDKNILTFE